MDWINNNQIMLTKSIFLLMISLNFKGKLLCNWQKQMNMREVSPTF